MEKLIKYKDQEFITLYDDEDDEKVNQYKWYYVNGYIVCPNKNLKLHRLILGVTDPKILIDHINGNPLDNRKCNLRISNQRQNKQNRFKFKTSTLKYKGVCRNNNSSTFFARIRNDKGERIYLGSFKTQEEAAKAYNNAAIKYHGDYAKLNNIL